MSNKIICNVCKGAKVYQISNLEFEECSKCKGKGFIKMKKELNLNLESIKAIKKFLNKIDKENKIKG